MKRYSIGTFATMLGITTQTLRNWDKTGKLKPIFVDDNGYRYYNDEQLKTLLGAEIPSSKKVYGYYREGERKGTLEEFSSYMTAQYGKDVEILSDNGIQMSLESSNLKTLILAIVRMNVSKLVLSSNTSVFQYYFDCIQYLATLYDIDVEIINKGTSYTSSEESFILTQAISGKLSQFNSEVAKTIRANVLNK